MRSPRPHLAAALLAVAAGAAPASTVMDQIGPDGSFQEGRYDNTTQIANLYGSAPQWNITVADDFVLAQPTRLDGIAVAMFATHRWSVFAGLVVDVFAQQPASGVVPVASLYLPAASIAFTTPWTTHPLGRLAQAGFGSGAPTLAAGSYWLRVAADSNDFASDIGVFASSYAGTPGNHNAHQIGSGLWGGGGDRALGADLAFRLDGTPLAPVPEPPMALLAMAGLAGLAGLVARHRLLRQGRDL